MKDKIRVVILADSVILPHWICHIIDWIEASSQYEVVGMVINDAENPNKSNYLFRALRNIDRRLHPSKNNVFKAKEVIWERQIEMIHVTPRQLKYSDIIEADDLQRISDLNGDLALRFGFRILRGNILSLFKYGIWSLHHGDNDFKRGGPPGFWEVVENESISGVTLQILTEKLDDGIIIDKAYTRTNNTSIYRNQIGVYSAGVSLFITNLKSFAKTRTIPSTLVNTKFYSNPLYRNPKPLQVAKTFLSVLVMRKVSRATKKVKKKKWSIGYHLHNKVERSLYRFKELGHPNLNYADPFPDYEDGKHYIFAEQFKTGGKGEIIYFEYNYNSKEFRDPQVIISEEYHLSYPLVLNWENRRYIVPESGNEGFVSVYECERFPDSWKMRTKWLEGLKLFDATLFYHEEIMYLFATHQPMAGMTTDELLVLYYSENFSIDNPDWKVHPKSPIMHDIRGGRCAGNIYIEDGRIYRPAQVGAPNYGRAIQIYEITELSLTTYEEVLYDTLEPNWDNKLVAIHTFNHNYKINVVDFQ